MSTVSINLKIIRAFCHQASTVLITRTIDSVKDFSSLAWFHKRPHSHCWKMALVAANHGTQRAMRERLWTTKCLSRSKRKQLLCGYFDCYSGFFLGLTVSGNKNRANGALRQPSPPDDGYARTNGLSPDSPPPEALEMHRPPPGRNHVKPRRPKPWVTVLYCSDTWILGVADGHLIFIYLFIFCGWTSFWHENIQDIWQRLITKTRVIFPLKWRTVELMIWSSKLFNKFTVSFQLLELSQDTPCFFASIQWPLIRGESYSDVLMLQIPDWGERGSAQRERRHLAADLVLGAGEPRRAAPIQRPAARPGGGCAAPRGQRVVSVLVEIFTNQRSGSSNFCKRRVI